MYAGPIVNGGYGLSPTAHPYGNTPEEPRVSRKERRKADALRRRQARKGAKA